MTDWLHEARAVAGELFELRARFHREPELGNHEFRTADRIERYLNALGIPTRRLLDTAVVGTLRGALPGMTAALRADMDALPMQETTGAPFASEIPGVMHACGHDVHMAAALGAAKLLGGGKGFVFGDGGDTVINRSVKKFGDEVCTDALQTVFAGFFTGEQGRGGRFYCHNGERRVLLF